MPNVEETLNILFCLCEPYRHDDKQPSTLKSCNPTQQNWELVFKAMGENGVSVRIY